MNTNGEGTLPWRHRAARTWRASVGAALRSFLTWIVLLYGAAALFNVVRTHFGVPLAPPLQTLVEFYSASVSIAFDIAIGWSGLDLPRVVEDLIVIWLAIGRPFARGYVLLDAEASRYDRTYAPFEGGIVRSMRTALDRITRRIPAVAARAKVLVGSFLVATSWPVLGWPLLKYPTVERRTVYRVPIGGTPHPADPDMVELPPVGQELAPKFSREEVDFSPEYDSAIIVGTNLLAQALLFALLLTLNLAWSHEDGRRADPLPPTWDIDPSPTLEIGELEGDPDYLFSEIVGALPLRAGSVAVADVGAHEIRVFDSRGALVGRSGGAGEGPGEFQRLGGIRMTPEGDIAAFDPFLNRLTVFTTDGVLRSTRLFRSSAGSLEIYLGSPSGDGHLVAGIGDFRMGFDTLSTDPMFISRFDSVGAELSEVWSGGGMRRLRGGPIPLSPHFLAAVIGDSVFVTDGLSRRIAVIDLQGDSIGTIDLPFSPPPVAESRAAVLERADSTARTRIEAQMEGVRIDSVPHLADLLADSEGLIWVKRYEPATDSHWLGRSRTGGEWWVFAPDGTPVARVRPPDDLRILAVGADRVVGLTRDELGVERVRVHPLTRSAPADPRR